MLQSEYLNPQYEFAAPKDPIHWGHFGAVFFVAVLLLGFSFIKNPQIFAFNSSAQTTYANIDVPHYYAYAPSAEDQPKPLVAGASTVNQGPSIINEDGSITPALDSGAVLGASTQDVKLSLDQVPVKEISDSPQALQNYIDQSQKIENSFINNSDFETALSSGDQKLIDQQSAKIDTIKNQLLALSVPITFVKLQKLKIIQYSAAVGILQNFTNADNNPELVGQYLDQFLKSQQDLDTETQQLQKTTNLNLGLPSFQTGASQMNSPTNDTGQ